MKLLRSELVYKCHLKGQLQSLKLALRKVQMTHLGSGKRARVDEEWLFDHGEKDSYYSRSGNWLMGSSDFHLLCVGPIGDSGYCADWMDFNTVSQPF